MGRGIALDVKQRYPEIPLKLGKLIKAHGNVPFVMDRLISFPVKPVSDIFTGKNAVKHMKNKFEIGDTIPGWACKADLELVRNSALRVLKIVNDYELKRILLARPACGNGELNWDKQVGPMLHKLFDDRFISCSFGCYTK